jgi:multidrug efflux pump subunit AcrB
LFLALTWTPALSQYFVRRKTASKDVDTPTTSNELDAEKLLAAEEHSFTGILGKIVDFYTRAMHWVIKHAWVLPATFAALVVLSYTSYRFLGSELLPEMDEGSFILDYITPPGSSLAESNRILDHIEQILHSTPEVDTTSRRTGLQLGLAAVTEANNGDFTVKLKPGRKRAIDDIISDIRSKVEEEEPAAKVEFVQLLQDMIGDLTSQPEPIVIKLFSQDGKLLNDTAPRVADAIGKIHGVVDILDGVENAISGPAVTFQVNPLVAARSGFTPEEIAIDASALLEGEPAAAPVVVNDRVYPIRVRFPDENRASLDRMTNTLLVSASGKTATLGSLARLESIPGETEIKRENSQRIAEVTGRLEGVDLGTGIAQVQKAVNGLHLPSTIRVEYGGLYEEQQKSFHDLVTVLLLAVLLLFAVLLFEFRTFSAPVAILVSALLSTCGGFVALLLTGITFNVASFIGLIMVIGIVAKNGILLLDAEHRFRAQGLSAEDSMIQAGRRRLRPIAMTALATIAGMLPLALGLGTGSQMLQPLAVAVVGGLLSSMVLSVIFTPVIHYYLQPRTTV